VHSIYSFFWARNSVRMNRLFPDWLINPGAINAWSATLTVSRRETLDEDLRDTLKTLPKDTLVDVVLADELALQRDVHVPRKAAKNANKVAALNLRSASPIGVSDLRWTETARTKAGSDTTITQIVVRQGVLDEISRIVAEGGFRLRRVLVADETKAVHVIEHVNQAADRIRSLWWGSTALACCAAFLGAWLHLQNSNTRIADLVAETRLKTTQLAERAIVLSEERDLVEAEQGEAQVVLDRLSNDMGQIETLLSLSETLPDHTWLTEFSVSAGDLRLTGFTRGNVPDLVELLEVQFPNSGIEMLRPVTIDRVTREKRFDLRLTQGEAANG